MRLSLQTFSQLLQRMSAAVQSSAGQPVDLSVGSVIRALLEANASIGLWIQWLIVRTLSMTRAATSSGADLDTWMADFLLVRQAALPASGQATFSRLLTEVSVLIPAGTRAKTSSGNISFITAVDTTNAAWLPANNGYLLPAGISAIDLPIVAESAGTVSNVGAGTISVLASAIPGLDFVSNALALSGGLDAENDAKFRTRFQDYINSRSRATTLAVGYAITSLRQSLRYKQFENADASGAWLPGHFLVVVDDGSGQPSASTLSDVYDAIDQVRPIGVNFSLRAPDIVPVVVSIALAGNGPPLSSAAQALLVSSVTSYIEQTPIGGTLSVTRIVEAAYRSTQFLNNITGVLINDAPADLICPSYGVLKTQSVTVN